MWEGERMKADLDGILIINGVQYIRNGNEANKRLVLNVMVLVKSK